MTLWGKNISSYVNNVFTLKKNIYIYMIEDKQTLLENSMVWFVLEYGKYWDLNCLFMPDIVFVIVHTEMKPDGDWNRTACLFF